MKQVLDETQQIHYVDECDIIEFITINSNMEWNKCCDYIREHHISSVEGKSHWRKSELIEENKDDYDPEAYYWILAFFEAHPWINKMMIVFDS